VGEVSWYTKRFKKKKKKKQEGEGEEIRNVKNLTRNLQWCSEQEAQYRRFKAFRSVGWKGAREAGVVVGGGGGGCR